MTDSRPSALIASLARIGDTALAAAQDRIELLALEVREEKCRIIESLLLAAASAALTLMGLTLATLGALYLLGESARIAALFTLGIFYLAGAGWAFRRLRGRLREWQSFSGTLGELQKDRACLENLQNSEHGKPSC